MLTLRPRWRRLVVAALTAAAPLSAVALAPASAATATVNVVGYSVVGPAFQALESAFQATRAGSGVTFTNSFGSSDTETENVAEGQPADIVNLSYTPNVTTLVTDGKVPANWATQEDTIGDVNVKLTGKKQQTIYPTLGILTDSIVVFVVRKGNPLKVTNWASLVKKGVQIVTPDPLTSGSAKWNLLAAYASQITVKKTGNASQAFLKEIIEHTVAQPSSGSAAMSAFVGGTGSVLLEYEDDALAALKAGQPIQIVTPPQTLLIENPIALTTTGVASPAAKAFYKYLYSVTGQGILASLGYRSVLKSVWDGTKKDFKTFEAKTTIATVASLGKQGWTTVDPEFFSPTVKFPKGNHTDPDQGIVTYLEQFAGDAV